MHFKAYMRPLENLHILTSRIREPICSVIVKQLKSMHLVKEFLIESAGFSLKYSKAKLPKRMSVLLD